MDPKIDVPDIFFDLSVKEVDLHLKQTTSSEVAKFTVRERELLPSHRMDLAPLVLRKNYLSPVTE